MPPGTNLGSNTDVYYITESLLFCQFSPGNKLNRGFINKPSLMVIAFFTCPYSFPVFPVHLPILTPSHPRIGP